MDKIILTKSEQKCFDVLVQKSGEITSRDEIAKSVWGDSWLEKYSDWQIDRLIYLLRNKLPNNYIIKTLRNSGYILTKKGVTIPKLNTPKPTGTMPAISYLEYMNNPKNKRKAYKDLFKSINFKLDANNILCINSYSYDNIDATYKKFPKSTVYFSNFNKKALKLHQDRIEKLNIASFSTIFDDINKSLFRDNFFDLLINDFRLNFNISDKQNILTIKNMYRILKPNSRAIVSVVIDPRDEKKKYGNKPWKFIAEENLERNCFSPTYYKKLFKNGGFKIVKEFDIEGGQKWKPKYMRFLLQN